MRREIKKQNGVGKRRVGLRARADAEAHVARIISDRDRIARRLRGLDPSDVFHVLDCLHRPFGSGRAYFLRELRPGVYVF